MSLYYPSLETSRWSFLFPESWPLDICWAPSPLLLQQSLPTPVLPQPLFWGCLWRPRLLTLLGREPTSLDLTPLLLDHLSLQCKGPSECLVKVRIPHFPTPISISSMTSSTILVWVSTIVLLDYHSSLFPGLSNIILGPLQLILYTKARVIFPRH